jgi:uncharacterized protein YqgC (DUF456 family)
MTETAEIAQTLGAGAAWIVTVALCLTGVLMSVVTLSGTWLVVLAAGLVAVLSPEPFPGPWTVLAFALIAGLVEGVEALAGAWGVMKRGGSKMAGFLAAVGGLVGFVVGGLIPIPLVGNLIGMLALGFVLVYAWERRRLKRAGAAASIAWGSVLGRLAVMLVKVAATVGMAAYLIVGMAG